MTSTKYTLWVGGAPVSSDLQAAIQQIEVEDHADMADMLRLRIAIGIKDGCSNWTVVDEDIFTRLAEIKLSVIVGSISEPLITAHIIDTRANFANQPGQSTLDVAAMDSTVLMNLEEKVRPWSNMADSDIASVIFGEYGFTTVVEQTQPSRQEVDVTTMQRGTDIRFLRKLAKRNGYECYVELNPLTGQVEGHFHPPKLDRSPQDPLSINLGEATNVNSFNARYDMLRPAKAKVTGLDTATLSEQPAQVEQMAQTGLGKSPSLDGDRPRKILLSQMGLAQTGELQTYAQAVVDRSSWAITANGEVNTVVYGGVLRAKRPVNVRGAGSQFSGTYYVEKVHHTFSGDGYTQRFSLRRNALGLTGSENFTASNALVG
ncbi:MAG: hypothetical protein GTO18_18820 [Anaerolineales bacterium]|nr:hypothetical protein [Anaerolineales bacterium]